MTSVIIVSHSGYGHTARLAGAVATGIGEVEGVALSRITIDADGEVEESAWETLATADAILFGSPTYMGGPSWQFKKFADASSKVWARQGWKDKLASGFTNSASMNGDKASTLAWFVTFAMQHGMVWAGTGMMPANTRAAKRDDANYLGAFTGLMAQSPADAGPDEAPPQGDLHTAALFGRRIAGLARRSGRS
ncbi:flavodoxin family protein [Acidiphilium sp. C61]|jgi:NAD(P)H dehydrogenase (quinone)|uniref:flavodoxin family protein n=1 Tax=Acidiphilium sp. C61 TaxID=1671485 RepID=UPI00157BACEA|nr:flavodoxin family protein [Acidiphilium sp. C61]